MGTSDVENRESPAKRLPPNCSLQKREKTKLLCSTTELVAQLEKLDLSLVFSSLDEAGRSVERKGTLPLEVNMPPKMEKSFQFDPKKIEPKDIWNSPQVIRVEIGYVTGSFREL